MENPTKMTLIDRSLYFKGLMLLIRKDQNINEEEKRLMMRIGKIMGFEENFCKNTIKDILANKNIDEAPPRFSNSYIAKCFIRDGIMISLVDKEMHTEELKWLKEIASVNGLENILQNDSSIVSTPKNIFDLENNLEVRKLNW